MIQTLVSCGAVAWATTASYVVWQLLSENTRLRGMLRENWTRDAKNRLAALNALAAERALLDTVQDSLEETEENLRVCKIERATGEQILSEKNALLVQHMFARISDKRAQVLL